MKAYNEYMNKISVSDTLHQKLVSCTTNTRPIRSHIMAKRYATVFACLAVVLLSVIVIPQLMQRNAELTPENNLLASQSDLNIYTPDTSKDYELYFNKTNNLFSTSDNCVIQGHFWQELTIDELKAVFPDLSDTHSVTATANFQSNESDVSLFNIDAHAVSASGLKTYIQISPNEIIIDYIMEGDIKNSDVFGTSVAAGYFETKPNSKGEKNIIYFASFKLSDIAYYVELGGKETEKETLKEEFSALIGTLIKGGTADLSVFHPIVPELHNDQLNLDEARADVDFGKYLPATIPDGFVFEEALRFINQEGDELSAYWVKGMGYIDWHVSTLDESDKMRITSIEDTGNYDLSLYPIPRADSVPNELREIVDNPIFLSEELTLEAVKSRTYEVSDSGDEPGPRMRFSVLYGDILVELRIKGASSEAMFDILQQIKK
ncbi:hypothetical protein [Proteiniborus sp. MB09-C3]|uniref:hypothetical protein n=1 Tax=Proteiniborus sp. MB09-C3 TaxID=3050072 RepID=UPI00255211EE|nr:hypothetical protein [Proteiniborus sp. MB09-C3]WIV13711.1 hypothetical protein QO263_08455 [Proteiniborus sp. MB09-C3]